MKIKWIIPSLSSSDLHSNLILPTLSPTVALHNTQIFPRMPLLYMHWSGTEVAKEHRAPQQHWMVFLLMVHSKVQILVYLVLWMFVFLGNTLVCSCYFWPCSSHSSSLLLVVCITLFWTLSQQSWSTSWTSWKTRIRKRLLQWAPIPSTSLLTIFIRTTSTHLTILMRKVCSTLCDKNILKPILIWWIDGVRNLGFVLVLNVL